MTPMSAPEDWAVWADPDWSVSFRHPSTDGAGQPVTVDRGGSQPTMQRVHVMADDRDEIYFEVVRAVGVTAAEFLASMRGRLPERYPDVSFGPFSRSGEWQCGSFTWSDQKRVVCLTEGADATYRVIYRPASTINEDIWETVEIR